MHFLLLDDERVSRFTLKQLVQSIPGALIHEAADANQAREQLAKLTAPAVCLFDVRLPGESGLELLAWLRTQPSFQSWPVLLCTGNEDNDTRQQAAKLRAEGYLPKPPDQESLQRITSAANRLAEDLLPDPRNLAQRLGASPSRLVSYVDALDNQVAELSKAGNEPAWQAQLGKCMQVGKALGSRYLVATLQQLQTVPAANRPEWLSATKLALGGMRERLG